MLHFPPMLRNQVILLLLLGCAWATSSGASGIVDEGCVNGQRVKRRARPGRVRLTQPAPLLTEYAHCTPW